MNKDNKAPSFIFFQKPEEIGRPILNQQAVAVYTALTILSTMRRNLGLEAMSEFLDTYIHAVERMNPELKGAVSEALSEHAVHNLYLSVRCYEKD